MKNCTEHKFYRHVCLGLSARKAWWGLPSEEAKKHGIRLVSTKKFSRSNLTIRGQEGFCRDLTEQARGLTEQSTGRADYLLKDVTFSWRGLSLRYTSPNKDNPERGFIRCRRVVGLRLELEVPCADSDEFNQCVMEYDEDPVLGKILRIWETAEGIEHYLTCFENGSAIETRPHDSRLMSEGWYWREL